MRLQRNISIAIVIATIMTLGLAIYTWQRWQSYQYSLNQTASVSKRLVYTLPQERFTFIQDGEDVKIIDKYQREIAIPYIAASFASWTKLENQVLIPPANCYQFRLVVEPAVNNINFQRIELPC